MAGFEDPKAGPQTILPEALKAVAERREPDRSCGLGRSFHSWIQRQVFAHITVDPLSLYRPLFRCQCILEPFAESVDEDETSYIFRVGPRIKLDDQTAIRVSD